MNSQQERLAERITTVVSEAFESIDRERLRYVVTSAVEVQSASEGGEVTSYWAMESLKKLASESPAPSVRIQACKAIVECECMIAGIK